MNLLIDIGNTFTHIGLGAEKRIGYDFKFPSHEKIGGPQVLEKLKGYRSKISFAAISSVVPPKTDFWIKFISKYFGIKPLIINANISLPIKIKIKGENSIGSDRICTAVAGYFLFKRKSNVIAIDLGTATTYNVVLKNGDFLGGIISLGIETSAKALNFNTEKLPLLTPRQLLFPRRVIGRNTLEAIQSGIMYSASFSIDGMVNQIEKECRRKFKIVLTGGNCRRMYRRTTHKARLEKYLVLLGLNHILHYNIMV
jgi:type III pantothenate kinase